MMRLASVRRWLWVSTLLVALAVAPLRALAQIVVFEDNFDGASLGPAWVGNDNGFPAPAIDVSGGFVTLGAFTSHDGFPYVINAQAFYPTIECVNIKILTNIQYSADAGGNGDGFVVLGGSNEELFMIWKDAADELYTQLNAGGKAAVADPDSAHDYALSIAGNQVTVLVDGTPNGLTGMLPATPAKIWFGHPATGQVFSMAAADAPPSMGHVDAGGTVTSSWWDLNAFWSSFKVDFVRVECIPPLVIEGGNTSGSMQVGGSGSPCDEASNLKVVVYDCGPNPGDCADCSPLDGSCPNQMLGMGTKDPITGEFSVPVSALVAGHYIYASDGCTEKPYNIGDPVVVEALLPAPLLSPRMLIALAVALIVLGFASLTRRRKRNRPLSV